MIASGEAPVRSKAASQDSEFPNRQTAFCRSKRCRRERNFWTQRPEAKNPPERPSLSAETGNSKIGVKNPRRNGLFSIGDGFRSSGRPDGGVRSQIRTGLHDILPVIRLKNTKIERKSEGLWRFLQLTPGFKRSRGWPQVATSRLITGV